MYNCYKVIIHGINVKEPFMIVIARDRGIVCLLEIERVMLEEREMCFFRRLQRHNTTTSLFFTTHTHTH